MSVNPNQFSLWFKNKKIINKNEAYFGSRRHEKSKVKTTIIRKFLGMCFIVFIRLLLNIKLKDSQCGFKVFHRSYALKVFKRINSFRFAFDVELLVIATKLNLRIKEMPVKLKIMKSFRFNSAVEMFYDVLKITYNYKILHKFDH